MDVLDAVQTIVQIAAVVVAGIWAYYKFVRGRTFARRAELEVAASLLETDGASAVRIQPTLRNTGAAKIPLRAKVVYVYAVSREGWRARVDWGDRIASAALFANHAWLEAQETIVDDVIVPLDVARTEGALAFRVECRVYEQRGAGGKGGIRWTANAVVPASLHEPRGAGAAIDAPLIERRRT
jgi:hypothetical protein